MSDFSKVHGPGYEQTNVNYLRQENATLKATLMALQTEIANRAKPTLGEVIDALNLFALNAEQGNEPAKQVLKGFVDALDRARTASSKLTIVRNNGAPPT